MSCSVWGAGGHHAQPRLALGGSIFPRKSLARCTGSLIGCRSLVGDLFVADSGGFFGINDGCEIRCIVARSVPLPAWGGIGYSGRLKLTKSRY